MADEHHTGPGYAPGFDGEDDLEDLVLIELDAEQIAGGRRPPREDPVDHASGRDDHATRGG